MAVQKVEPIWLSGFLTFPLTWDLLDHEDRTPELHLFPKWDRSTIPRSTVSLSSQFLAEPALLLVSGTPKCVAGEKSFFFHATEKICIHQFIPV